MCSEYARHPNKVVFVPFKSIVAITHNIVVTGHQPIATECNVLAVCLIIAKSVAKWLMSGV